MADRSEKDILADVHRGEELGVPQVYASAVVIQPTGNDFNLIFSRSLPVKMPDGSVLADGAKIVPTAHLVLSPQTLKDFALVALGQVAAFEESFGKIATPYTQARDAQSKK